jgi:Mrp family chromosome partitioning ATPase
MTTWADAVQVETRGDAAQTARLAPASRALNGHANVAKSIDQLPTAAVEAVRDLLSSLQQEGDKTLPTRFGFTSALAGEGVSFIARAVAAVLAHDFRQRVCLVDMNWANGGSSGTRRRSTGRRRRGTAGDDSPLPGLAEVLRRELSRRDPLLADDDPRRDTRRSSQSLRELLYETTDPRLTYVAAGEATEAESQVFARSEQLPQIIASLARHHDSLILDLPAVLSSSIAVPLSRQANAVALVVRQGVTGETQVRAALERLSNVQVAGVVLNRTSSKIPRVLRRRIAAW